MSKSLRAQIESEVRRREKLKQPKKPEQRGNEEEGHVIIEKYTGLILQSLDVALNNHLNWLAEYEGHSFGIMESYDPFILEKAANRLGFFLRFEGRTNIPHIYFQPIQKRGKKTIAQEKLLEFRKKLAEARTKRKNELLVACQKVKELMEQGKYENKTNSDGRIEIYVEANEKVILMFETVVVKEFFRKFNINFSGITDNYWIFSL